MAPADFDEEDFIARAAFGPNAEAVIRRLSDSELQRAYLVLSDTTVQRPMRDCWNSCAPKWSVEATCRILSTRARSVIAFANGQCPIRIILGVGYKPKRTTSYFWGQK